MLNILWQIILLVVFGLLAFYCASTLGRQFHHVRAGDAMSAGSIALNILLSLAVGATVGLAHYVPRATQAAGWGIAFFVISILLLVASTLWFVIYVTRVREFIAFAFLALAIIFAANSSFRVMSTAWSSEAATTVLAAGIWVIFAILIGFAAFIMAMRKYFHTHKLVWKIVAIILVILTIISLVIIPVNATNIAGTSSGTTSKDSGTPSPSDTKVKDAINHLTVPLFSEADLEKLTTEKYKDVSEVLLTSSLSPHDKARTEKTGFSDALTYGFESDNSTKMFRELEIEILRNPIYGVAVANAIRDKKVGDTRIGKFNPWLDQMIEKNAEGVHVWCEYRDSDAKTVYVTTEYRRYAATLCTFLERLLDQGVQAHQTIENWCLNLSATNNARAGVKADYQYKKDALILAYVTKDQAGSKNPTGFIIGFNIHDKRPEFYGEDTPDTPNVPDTPSNPDNPDNPDNPPSSTPTPTKPSPGPGPEPEPEPTTYNKDKSLSDNSGKNDDPGPGPDTNNGEGAQYSSKDNKSNSDHMSEEEYDEAINNLDTINDNQKTADDGSDPSYDGGGTADNNGAAANTPSPDKPKESAVSGDPEGQQWDGPDI